MANIKIQPEKRYLYIEKKSAGNMKTTSIYTLFFSPTGTSRKIAAAVAQGMTETEGTATEESAGHNADAAQAPSSGQVPGAGPAAAAAPEPAAGNGGETKSMHGEPTVTAIDLTHPAGYPAPLPGEAVAIFAVPVYGGHVAPAALERLREIRGEGTPAVVLAVYGNRSFGTAVAELASFVAGRGFVPVAAGAFVGEHSYSTPETPIAQGTPRRTGSGCRQGIRGSGARKISKNRAFPRQEPGNGIRHRSNHPGNPNRQHGCSQGPRNGRPCPHRPRETARTAYAAPPEAALHPVRTGIPPPAETPPRRPAARGRCRTLHAMRPLRRTVPHAGHRTRRRAAHRPGTLHPLLRLRERVRLRCPHIPHALCSRPGPEFVRQKPPVTLL